MCVHNKAHNSQTPRHSILYQNIPIRRNRRNPTSVQPTHQPAHQSVWLQSTSFLFPIRITSHQHSSMSDDEQEQPHDLSPYELLRLEKIRRNQAKLEALGLGGGSIGTLAGVAPKKKKKKFNNKQQQKKRPRTNARRQQQQPPTRSSKRLRDMKERQSSSADQIVEEEAAHEVDDDNDDNANGGPQVIDYDYLPQEPDQLDDDEFQVYTSLRAWRLRRKNELEVEPYKICQNRTLCELIRRVRNDPCWGALEVETTTSKGGGIGKATTSPRSEEDVAADLIECWGLGPSKVAADGFGPEMMAVIAEEGNAKLLEASRARSNAGGDLDGVV